MSVPILIVGAGPTGLALALRLRRHGTPFRIVDRHAGPGEASRALIVHARTLELYAQLGLADRLIAAGTRVEAIRLREGGREVGAVRLHDMGEGLSPYPFALCLPQDEHKRLLVEALAEEGVTVEWGTALTRLDNGPDAVTAVLSREGREEEAAFAYVAGCDGAHSAVRAGIGASMEGGTYDRLYYVADVKPRRPPGPDLVVALDAGDFALMLPARRGENERLIGFVPPDREAAPRFEDVQASAERLLGVEIGDVNWFSTYRVHHRVAARFRDGRCFLLGDAGHLHSPAGGQGMNTGIGDAVNLGWKLAAVVSGRAAPALLDSYEPERLTFARRLVATTDRAFQIISDEGLVGRAVRSFVVPHVLPAAMRFAAGQHGLFTLVSQIRIAYPDSPLSEGKAGGIAGGDRLPWVREADNLTPLDGRNWQLHGFGDLAAPMLAAAAALDLPVHRFDWSEGAAQAGFSRGAGYLVRPDGYVALALPEGEAAALTAYAARLGLEPGRDGPAPAGP